MMESSQGPEGDSPVHKDEINSQAPLDLQRSPPEAIGGETGERTVPVQDQDSKKDSKKEKEIASTTAETSVSALVVPCLKNLNRVVSADLSSFESEVAPALWKDEMGRLRVWAANIGAHKTGQSSLDHRLRDSSHIREQTVRVLGRLQRIIEDIDDALNHTVEHDDFSDISEQSDDEDNLTEMQSIYQALRDTINNLFQLSMVIRQPAQHDRLVGTKRSDASFYEHFDRQHVMGKYPEVGEEILNRLGLAISQRRAVLRYRERHRMKLGQGLSSAIEDEEEGKSAKLSDTVATTFIDVSPATKDEWESQTVASKTSYAATLINGAEGATLPNPPKGSANGAPFECPYCFIIITIANRSAWARHIFNDLMPYLCIFPECSTPHKLYESRREWFAHLHEQHSVQDGPYTSTDCPLCLASIPGGKQLERHIGRHLEELALFALPRSDEDGEDPFASDEEQGQSEKSLKHDESDEQHSVNGSAPGDEDNPAFAEIEQEEKKSMSNQQPFNEKRLTAKGIITHVLVSIETSRRGLTGWRDDIDLKYRISTVWNVINALILSQPGVDIDAAAKTALDLEEKALLEAGEKSEYNSRCEKMFSRSEQARETQAAIAAELQSVSEDSPAQVNTQNDPQTREQHHRGSPSSAVNPTVHPDLAEEVQYSDEESDETQEFDGALEEMITNLSEESSEISDLEDEDDRGPAPYHTEAPRPIPQAPFPRQKASGSLDMIFIRSRGLIYRLRFEESAIDDNTLTVGMLRIAAASKLNLSNPSNLRLLYKGNLLRDDSMPCKLEGIKHRSELMCVISEPEAPESSASDTESESGLGQKPKPLPSKPRARGRSSMTPRHNSPIRDTSEPDPFYFEESPLSPEDVNFKLLPPMEQVNRIADDFDTRLLPLCNKFVRAPPIDENQRQSEYRAFSESILETVLLRVDNVDTRGDPNVRIARKNLIMRGQSLLNDLERAARP